MRFKDKVAIVCGGGSPESIGEAIAEGLAAEGGTVYIWDINEQGCKEITERINSKGGKAVAVKMNAMDYAEVYKGVKAVVTEHGKLDIMISTVGGGVMMPFEHCTFEFFKKQLDFQIDPTFNCAHAALDFMKKQNFGYMLFFTSSTGGAPVLPGYQAGKAAVKSIVQSIAAETEMFKQKVNINAILPGMVDTPLTRGAFAKMTGGTQRMQAMIAAKARGISTPPAVAKVALFLVSDDAYRINGQVIEMI